jgi:hypothetical protein
MFHSQETPSPPQPPLNQSYRGPACPLSSGPLSLLTSQPMHPPWWLYFQSSE